MLAEMNTVIAMGSTSVVSSSSKPMLRARNSSFQAPRRVAIRPDGNRWAGRQRVRADASADTTSASSASSDSTADLASSGTNGAKSPMDKSANGQGGFEISTLAVHAGERGGRPRVADALTTPIVQTATYWFKDTEELIAYQEGTYGSFEYGRYGNPTTMTLEKKIAELEHAESCLVSASGMNSATTMLLALVPAGGHIVTTTDCYRRTRQFIQTFLPKMNISATVLEPDDIEGLKKALEEHDVSLYFSESPTNPYLRCIDVPKISALCHEHNALAILLGADLVLHSATKYMCGHNDALAGAICGSEEHISAIRSLHNVLGGVIDPHVSYAVIRGLKTLQLRVKRCNETAFELARRLEAHPKISRVWYPGLESHPDHEVAVRQMPGGYGGVISYEVDGGLEDTARYIDSLKIPYIAPSLGGVESLVEQPAIVSYWDQGVEGRAKLGIKENLVRHSIGIEDIDDLWADMEQALEKI